MGELDLTSRIRRPEPTYLAELAQVLVRNHTGIIRRVYLSADAEREFRDHLTEQEKTARAEGVAVDSPIQVIGVPNLTSLLNTLWPDLGVAG